MATSPNVTARFDELDKQALVELAARFQRSQTDILRILAREAVNVLREEDAKFQAEQAQPRAITRRMKSKPTNQEN